MMWISLASLALTVASGQQAAAAKEPETPITVVPQEADPNKRVCRIHKMTGSRLARKRVCMTANDWRIQDEEMAAEARAITNKNGALIEKPG